LKIARLRLQPVNPENVVDLLIRTLHERCGFVA
jgi:hypothetical protein